MYGECCFSLFLGPWKDQGDRTPTLRSCTRSGKQETLRGRSPSVPPSRCPPIQVFSQTRCPPVQVSPPGQVFSQSRCPPGLVSRSPDVLSVLASRPDAQQPSPWGWSPVRRRETRHPCMERSREEGAAWGQGPQRVHHPRTSTWSPGRVQVPLTVPWRYSVSGWAGTLRRPCRGMPPRGPSALPGPGRTRACISRV